jgi:hypothetical protein
MSLVRLCGCHSGSDFKMKEYYRRLIPYLPFIMLTAAAIIAGVHVYIYR